MIIRLHNLSARAPKLSDAQAIVELMHLCAGHTSDGVVATEEELCGLWRKESFCLTSDAWVITNVSGQIVGYASVQRNIEQSNIAFDAAYFIHPHYNQRGIETLLIWLVEVRTRQLILPLPRHEQVTLRTTVSCADDALRLLFEREGYCAVRRFWRLLIEMQKVAHQNSGQFQVDVDMDNEQVDVQTGSELYSVRQYETYEKVLRIGTAVEVDKVVSMHCATA